MNGLRQPAKCKVTSIQVKAASRGRLQEFLAALQAEDCLCFHLHFLLSLYQCHYAASPIANRITKMLN